MAGKFFSFRQPIYSRGVPLKVITYNTAGAQHYWHIVNFLRKGGDVVCLQEVHDYPRLSRSSLLIEETVPVVKDTSTVEILAAELGLYAASYPTHPAHTSEFEETKVDLAILSKFKLVDAVRVSLPTPPVERSHEKPFIKAKIKVGGKWVTIVNFHGPSHRYLGTDPWDPEFSEYYAVADEKLSSLEGYVIISGDLNIGPEDFRHLFPKTAVKFPSLVPQGTSTIYDSSDRGVAHYDGRLFNDSGGLGNQIDDIRSNLPITNGSVDRVPEVSGGETDLEYIESKSVKETIEEGVYDPNDPDLIISLPTKDHDLWGSDHKPISLDLWVPNANKRLRPLLVPERILGSERYGIEASAIEETRLLLEIDPRETLRVIELSLLYTRAGLDPVNSRRLIVDPEGQSITVHDLDEHLLELRELITEEGGPENIGDILPQDVIDNVFERPYYGWLIGLGLSNFRRWLISGDMLTISSEVHERITEEIFDQMVMGPPTFGPSEKTFHRMIEDLAVQEEDQNLLDRLERELSSINNPTVGDLQRFDVIGVGKRIMRNTSFLALTSLYSYPILFGKANAANDLKEWRIYPENKKTVGGEMYPDVTKKGRSA